MLKFECPNCSKPIYIKLLFNGSFNDAYTCESCNTRFEWNKKYVFIARFIGMFIGPFIITLTKDMWNIEYTILKAILSGIIGVIIYLISLFVILYLIIPNKFCIKK